MDTRPLFSITLVVFIGLLGSSLVLPLLPNYAEIFDASEFTTGLVIASYAAMQLFGAPILGRLSGRIGRRPALSSSVSGIFAGFFLLGFANAIWILLTSRNPGGGLLQQAGTWAPGAFSASLIAGLTVCAWISNFKNQVITEMVAAQPEAIPVMASH